MLDFLLPRSDGAVLIQFAVVGLAGGIAIWKTWDNTDRRILAIGATILLIGLLGLRAVH